jgi:hypothetical protein
MNFINFIAWLTAGAVIGWFARNMVEIERKRVMVAVPDDELDF